MFKKVLNQKGFTLTEVMIAAAITGFIALVIIESTRIQTKTSNVSQAESDISAANSEILNILNSPGGCNANLKNSSAVNITTLAASRTYVAGEGIYVCNTGGTCTNSGTSSTNTTLKYTIISSTSTTWAAATTKFNSGKVRITAVSLSIPAASGTLNTFVPALMTVTFQKKLGVAIDPVASPTQFTTVTKTYSTTVIANGTTFIGCIRNLSSTLPY